MRVVGGRLRGRPLAPPRGNGIRPTGDRTREAVFNVLEHRFRQPAAGARVLDLFAGTGALGVEALSRGAEFCLFVEEGAEARALIRGNMEALGLNGCAKIFRRDATRLGSAGTMAPFSLVFADPPYDRGLAPQALDAARSGGWLVADALCVVEEAAAAPFELPAGFTELDSRHYGDTIVRFLRLAEGEGSALRNSDE